MWNKIKDYIVVTLIAVLIWLQAELRTVKEHEVLVDIQLAPPPGQELVVEPAMAPPVRVKLQCPVGQINQVQNIINKGPIKIEVYDDPAQTTQQVNLLEELQNKRIFRDMGVRVLETSPERLRLRVEAYRELALPVEVRVGSLPLSPPPTVEPRQVTVRVPESLTVELEGQEAMVDLEHVDLAQYGQNVPVTLELPIVLPPVLRRANGHVQVRPQTAKVTFTIRKQTTTITLPSVPILMIAPPSEMDRFEVALGEEHRVLHDLTLQGPPDLIERIKNREVEVWAQFRLTTDDLERGVNSAPLTIMVPPGVVVESPPAPITFTITRQE